MRIRLDCSVLCSGLHKLLHISKSVHLHFPKTYQTTTPPTTPHSNITALFKMAIHNLTEHLSDMLGGVYIDIYCSKNTTTTTWTHLARYKSGLGACCLFLISHIRQHLRQKTFLFLTIKHDIPLTASNKN